MESEIWSATLSGCPSVTDSEVKKKRSLLIGILLFGLRRRQNAPTS
jgi:hypothetical protein